MSALPRYLDRETAAAVLSAQGFNSLDIECILDLAGPVMRGGAACWPAGSVERLAARAWWLDRSNVRLATSHAA
ncbi:MAG: hypothetical protein K9G30_05675 [Parvibaculum sp.]|nr:hypothetical protein [Parvibaculum sp.]